MLKDRDYYKSTSLQKGFTLIEVLIAVAIVSIMAAAFLPMLSNNLSNIFKPGYRQQALYQAQTDLDNFSNSTNTDSITVGSTTIHGTLTTVTKTVSGHTVSLYYFYAP